MKVTLNLSPEVEKVLMARAHGRGVSLNDYLQELVAKKAGLPAAADPLPIQRRFDNLSDLLLGEAFVPTLDRNHVFLPAT